MHTKIYIFFLFLPSFECIVSLKINIFRLTHNDLFQEEEKIYHLLK